MFGVDGNSEVQIEGQIIRVPKLTGNNGKYETFSSTTFYFTKPSWEPDSCATSCNLCETRFTQLKRKHHCRNCGKIFCAKCCKNKIPLPHFGLDESQRVCDLCRSTAELVGLSRSQYVSHRQDAAKGLADMMETPAEMGKMIEAGGVHILISLTSQGDNKIKKTVAKSLHRISHHIELHDFMMEIGAIKALLHILSSVTPNQEDTLADCLGSLLLFFHNSDYKMKALKEGALDTFVRLLNTPGVLALLAARALSLLVDMPEAQTLITQSSPSVLSRLFMTFKVKNNEGVLQPYLIGLVKLSENAVVDRVELLISIARGLANFADFEINSIVLTNQLPTIVDNLMRPEVELLKLHTCRLVTNLLTYEMTYTSEMLNIHGGVLYLQTLFSLPDMRDLVNNCILTTAPRLSQPYLQSFV
ncbi:uncharacterized protein LOC143255900 isoform X2 [Tachypleus tridentatus]|uniref:uncharacterized protein LOC143255900 isoform X2 n=1 Tax=Tachypleus tridentatus TaxID=6853 RepID=UPI003FD06552